MVEMKNKIEEERARLESDRDMAAEERTKIANSLREHEADLATAQAEQDAIKQKLVALGKLSYKKTVKKTDIVRTWGRWGQPQFSN